MVMPSAPTTRLNSLANLAALQVNDNVSVYGELSGITGDELSVGSKLGLDWAF